MWVVDVSKLEANLEVVVVVVVVVVVMLLLLLLSLLLLLFGFSNSTVSNQLPYSP